MHEPADPASEADRDAARRWMLFWNAWYLDPALRGTYPDVFPGGVPAPVMGIEEGDLEKTRAAFDFIGLNHYNRLIISTAQPVIPGGLPGQPDRNAEVEPQVAVNPLNPSNWIVNWQQDRWNSGGASGVVTASTFDGGATWSRTAFAVSRCGGGNAANGGDYARATDPWVTFSPNGIAYQMALAFDGASLQPGSRSGMLVARSSDGGRTWGAVSTLILSDSSFFNDKNAITADPTDARYVYAVWVRLALAGGGPSLLARTTDGGASWEAATVIYDPGIASQTIGNQVVVLPNGTLLNVFTWLDRGPNGTMLASIHVIRLS